MITKHKIESDLTWTEIISPDEDEKKKIIKSLGLSMDLLDYSLDPNESARIELDKDTGFISVIFDILTPDPRVAAASEPVGLLITKDLQYVTIARHATRQIAEHVSQENNLLPKKEKITAVDLLLNTIYSGTSEYINAINKINRQRNLIQSRLKHKTSSTDINHLLELETVGIYLKDSIRTNGMVLSGISKVIAKLTEHQRNVIHSIETENDQATDMINQATEMVNSIADAYQALNNQALNRTLNILTVWTIFLAIPTMITGFYGMNTPLPLQKYWWAWIFVIIISILAGVGVYFYLRRKNIFDA